MTTQLNRVLNVLSDGDWHSLPDIGKTLAIQPRSAASRIRDLRLNQYGNHRIEIRKTKQHRVFEYRLLTPSKSSVSVTGSATFISGPAPTANVKFLNTLSMTTEMYPRSQCSVVTENGFSRIVAKQLDGTIIPYLITTQSTL